MVDEIGAHYHIIFKIEQEELSAGCLFVGSNRPVESLIETIN